MVSEAPLKWRLVVRGCLTIIFATFSVLGFAFGRPVVGGIMLAFLAASCGLLVLVLLLRERKQSAR